jgi:NAD(P)H-dependent FMN reductase
VTIACRLLLVSGSLRSASTNTAVLRTAQTLAPDGVTTSLSDALGALPHFNPDDDHAPLPPAVAALRAEIHGADALLFCTPEYAGALPGSFKNLLDWTIGDDEVGSIYEKPVAWINASPRVADDAHASLRTVLTYAHATIVEEACAHIPVTAAMVDHGVLTDAATRGAIVTSVTALARYVSEHR